MSPGRPFGRRSRYAAALVGLAATLTFGLAAAPAASGADLISDGGFESASSGNSPNWEATATGPFPTPFCIIAGSLACQNGGGTAGPRSGEVWSWFGGTGAVQTQSISQSVTIPPGSATLSFYLWIGAYSGTGDEAVEVFLDRTKLFGANQGQAGFYGGYRQVMTSVDDFADGKSHTLRFSYSNPTASPPVKDLGLDPTTNMHVDDVSLTDLPLIPDLPPFDPDRPPVIPELPNNGGGGGGGGGGNGGGTGGGRDRKPPKVTVLRGPKSGTHKRFARFRFTAHELGVSYQCRLDRKPFRRCRAVTFFRHLKPGRHLLRVQAIDAAGNRGPVARHPWKIVRRRAK